MDGVNSTLTELFRLQIFFERSGALNRREWTTAPINFGIRSDIILRTVHLRSAAS